MQIYRGARVGGKCVTGEYARIGLNAVVVGNPGQVMKIEGKR